VPVHGAPVVSSYFFSVLYFYVMFVLPFVVKYRFSIEQRVIAAVAAATVHIMMMMSVSAMPAAFWPTVTVRVFVRVTAPAGRLQ